MSRSVFSEETKFSEMSMGVIKEFRNTKNVCLTACILKDFVPQTETELLADLDHLIHSDFVYSDDKSLQSKGKWLKLQAVVNLHVKDTDVEWKKKFIDIFINNL